MMAFKAFVVLTYVVMIAMNFIANTLPLGGQTTGDISNKYPSLFTPAGFTFSIWGLIYVLLAVAVWRLISTPSDTFGAAHALVAWVLIISSIFNVAWLVAWHHDRIVLSTIVMIALFTTLAIGFTQSPGEWTSIRVALSVYFAWVSVALIANVAIMLVALNMPLLGVPASCWLIGVLLIGLGLATVTVLTQRDMVFGLVFIWAYVGIFIRHVAPLELNRAYPLVILTLGLALALLSGVSALRFALNGFSLFGRRS